MIFEANVLRVDIDLERIAASGLIRIVLRLNGKSGTMLNILILSSAHLKHIQQSTWWMSVSQYDELSGIWVERDTVKNSDTQGTGTWRASLIL